MAILSVILSTVFSVAPIQSFFGRYENMLGSGLEFLLLLYFLIFLVTALREPRLSSWFFSVVLCMGVIVSFYAIYFQWTGFDPLAQQASERFLGRVYATFGHPNMLGQLRAWVWLPLRRS